MHECETLDDYLTRFGPLLGQQAQRSMAPLHVPGRDSAELPRFNRSPFEPQAHVITASVKALRRQKALLMVGEMGTGKTLMGMAAVHAHAAGKPYQALVFCPGQLCKKWEREIKNTIPGAQVRQIRSFRDLLEFPRTVKQPTWSIISRDRAKLGAKWRPAFIMKHGQALCPDCGQPAMDKKRTLISPKQLARKKHTCLATVTDPVTGQERECGAALWQYTREINRWEPARYIQKRLRGVFDYLILDEVHEEKGANTAQANAAGSLVAACKKVIALTGTLIGGYAEHLRPLLFRMCPRTLVEEGFRWNQVTAFSERYGRIETKIIERDGGGVENRMSRGGTTKVKTVRPGIMPTLFGRHLIGNTVFLSLEEVADNLPELREIVEPVAMDDETAREYRRIERHITAALKQMVVRGDRRLLGTMLNTLLAYPDHPYGWEAVGYWDRDDDGNKLRFHEVTQPKNLHSTTIRPKERKLIELVQREKDEGRQSWVFVQLTDKRDVAGRLERLLSAQGLSVKVLRSSVPLAQREEWIAEHGPEADIVISHPKLVETGLDLFDKGGRHNFSTLIFYETGYNTFTLRQASRRSWRIGQQLSCRVIYLYYEGTMQERAMTLMGRKLTAAQAVEGRFSSDGLAALAGDDGSVEMALAKSLAERLDDLDAQRAWSKLGESNVVVDEAEGSETFLPSEPDDDEAVLESPVAAGFLFAC